MTPEQRSQLKQTIQARIAELESILAKDDEEAKPVAPDVAIGRLSRLDSMQGQQMSLAMQRRRKSELSGLRDALSKVDSPTYGICPLCRKEIPFERLEAIPDAVLCVSCSPSR